MGYVVGSNFGSSFGIEVDNIIGNWDWDMMKEFAKYIDFK
jgi:hypothetical protein